MLNGQHPGPGTEPSKGLEERLLSVLKEFQEQRQGQHQRPKHQRSSSLFAGSPGSDNQTSCKPPASKSGSLISPACASMGPPSNSSSTSAPDIPSVPAPKHSSLSSSHLVLGRVRLNSNLSRSSGHARSILTGSSDGNAPDSMLSRLPSNSNTSVAGNTHAYKLGAMAKDTSILSGAESNLLARHPAHPPCSNSSTTLAGKGTEGVSGGGAGSQPSASVPTSTADKASIACNGCAPSAASNSPRSPLHQRTPSLLLQQLHVRTPSLSATSNSSSVTSRLHSLASRGSTLDSALSSPRKAAPHSSETIPPPPAHTKLEGPSANTSNLPVQPTVPTATAPQQQQQQHRRALSTCAALLTGAWDAPAVQQQQQQQQQEGSFSQPQQPQHHALSALLNQQDTSQQQQQDLQTSSCGSSSAPSTVQHDSLLRSSHTEQQQHLQPLSRGSSSAATTVYHDSLQPPSHKEQREGLFGLLHAAATAAAAAAAAHKQQQQQQRQQSTLTSISTSPLPSAASSEPALSPSTPQHQQHQQHQQQQQEERKREHEEQQQQQRQQQEQEQQEWEWKKLKLQQQQQQQQQQEHQEMEWQKLQKEQRQQQLEKEQQERKWQQLQQQQQQQHKRAHAFSTPPPTPPPRLASSPPSFSPESSQATTPTRSAQNKAHTLHSVQLGTDTRSPVHGAQQQQQQQQQPAYALSPLQTRSASHTPYRPPLTPIASEQDELSSPVPAPIPAESPTHTNRRASATYSSHHPTHSSSSLGQRSVRTEGGVDLSSPTVLQQQPQPHSHAGVSSTSSRPHSRRTTSTSGVGSLYGREEGEVRRSARDVRDRRYYTSADEHPMGHPHHSRSSSSMATMPMSAPSTASSRMATNAATQRHRVPAAPVGTTAAVAAVTGRPNTEGTTTPITSTAVMMGGFNAISHSRVRSIDLATDMLLGGGRSGRSNSEHSGHSSRLQHHSSHTQH